MLAVVISCVHKMNILAQHCPKKKLDIKRMRAKRHEIWTMIY